MPLLSVDAFAYIIAWWSAILTGWRFGTSAVEVNKGVGDDLRLTMPIEDVEGIYCHDGPKLVMMGLREKSYFL